MPVTSYPKNKIKILLLENISDAAVAANINPKPQSGRQEYLENLVNRFV